MTLQGGPDLYFRNYQYEVDMGHLNSFFSKMKSPDYVWLGLFVFFFQCTRSFHILAIFHLCQSCLPLESWVPAPSLVFSISPQHFCLPTSEHTSLSSILKVGNQKIVMSTKEMLTFAAVFTSCIFT